MDRKIAGLLAGNGRMTASEIGRIVSLSVPAVTERIRKMEERGVITGYEARLDRSSIGLGLLAFLFVDIEETKWIEGFRKQATAFPEVLECHHIAGEHDYLLKVVAEDTRDLERFLMEKLKAVPGVRGSRTHIVFSTLKETSTGGDLL